MRVMVRLEDGDRPLKVGDRTLAPGAATTLELTEDITLTAGDPGPTAVGTIEDSRDVFSPLNRPNGPVMTAGVAPKLPKSGGETAQVPVGGEGSRATAERPVAELGRATQGGGPESEDTLTTPGPQPEQGEEAFAPQAAAASGGPEAAGAKPPAKSEPKSEPKSAPKR